jgi:hypothetical protein
VGGQAVVTLILKVKDRTTRVVRPLFLPSASQTIAPASLCFQVFSYSKMLITCYEREIILEGSRYLPLIVDPFTASLDGLAHELQIIYGHRTSKL